MSLSITGNLLTGPFLRPDITDPNDLKLIKKENITKDGLTVSETNEQDGHVTFTMKKEPKSYSWPCAHNRSFSKSSF